MSAGLRGRLITASFIRDLLPELDGDAPMPSSVERRIQEWAGLCDARLGPASSVRALADLAAVPLLEALGFEVAGRHDAPHLCHLQLAADGRTLATAVVVSWDHPLQAAWRNAVLEAAGTDGRWCFCCNGRALRLVDGRRTWSREYLEIDLAQLAADADLRRIVWTLVRADALAGVPSRLDLAVDRSARYGVDVCRALGCGVLEALQLLVDALARRSRGRQPGTVLFDHALTVLYRLLFLLFAEARGLVPLWHPVYRDRYSLDGIVAALLAGRPLRGLWRATQAISRLAHDGCLAGELKVTAFNGRLFAPARTAIEALSLDDAVMREAVLAVSTASVHARPGTARRHRTAAGAAPTGIRRRIVYRDLDVEQLGAVYEEVLEYQPSRGDSAQLTRTRDRRKASGTFYTPRSVTTWLVRQTLEPLVRQRPAGEILSLRVLDPAMGSGAFLVAACRYLAEVAEQALVAEGRWHPGDVTPADRAGLRRDVASRCLFGVDLNPTAVQLARLSLWLATLAADKPLSFLDHRLVAGNSLIGAAPADLSRQPSRVTGRSRGAEVLPLFGDDLPEAVTRAARLRMALALERDDTAAIVRNKERLLATLQRDDTALVRWTKALDLWCAGWFWPDAGAPDRGTFHELCTRLLHGTSSLPDHLATPLLTEAAAVAGRHGFLHWPLVFPEVLTRTPETPAAGFDAVIGNPPWDMVRGDGDRDARPERKTDARHLTAFVRESGVYAVASQAHVNRYQLFVERALQLVRSGGRIGLVLPGGVATDTGAAPLRRHLFDRAAVDSIAGFDNRHGIFPIHRSVRFALMTCTAGRPTDAITCRFGIHRTEELDAQAPGSPLVLPRRLLARLSGDDDLGVPEIASAVDLAIVEKISARHPRLGSPDGWNARFGRELNATDDRHAFMPCPPDVTPAHPVVEGRQVTPFRVALDCCRLQLTPAAARRHAFTYGPRLAFRDVASATNRLTLIAGIVPGTAASTHTVACLKTPLPLDAQHVLCALLNSFVANYLVRLRVNTHVAASLVARLPVPHLTPEEPDFGRLAALSEALSAGAETAERMAEYVEVQALAARLYGLTGKELEHVLNTFPLIETPLKAAVVLRFTTAR